MKLQAELDTVIEAIKRRKEEVITYAAKLKESGSYKDYDTRLAHDVLRGVMGTSWICGLYDKYDCNDTHITTLGKQALKIALA
jgi:hypothetical protein